MGGLTSNRNLGIALVIGLIIENVLPRINMRNFGWISTIIYIVVAIILLFIK